MARLQNKLSARTVATLTKPGRHADGGGLYLELSVRDGFTRRSWLYLFTWQGKLRAMGLGAYPAVPLAEARGARNKWRAELQAGRNPIEVRRGEKAKQEGLLFGACAEMFFEAKAAKWRNPKTAANGSGCSKSTPSAFELGGERNTLCA
jgi:hypothetical protein